jgi:hypothetical protein
VDHQHNRRKDNALGTCFYCSCRKNGNYSPS